MNTIISFFHNIQSAFSRIGAALLSVYVRFCTCAAEKPFRLMGVLALLLNLLLEILGRRSPLAGITFALLHPYIFLLGALIVYLTLTLSYLFARRAFALTVISLLWLILGIVNCVILGMRNTPLAAIDFGLITSCLDIITVYLRIPALILIALALAAVILVMLRLFRIAEPLPAHSFSRGRGLLCVGSTAAIFAAILLFSVRTGAVQTKFADLPGAYADCGFAYCFSISVVDRGIDRPDGYSDDEIDAILTAIESQTDAEESNAEAPPGTETAAASGMPNIIFVQLESFFDVNRLRDITFSENPVPVFSALKEQYPSGYLTVPSIGAGTANKEFEVLTGMNLDDFGAGEYPYKTVLRHRTAESLAFNLRSLGYTAHAIHNNTGAFYDRNQIYAALGFDTFTSLEYMENVTYNPLGWAKDAVLTDTVQQCLRATDTADVIFAVSVQPHGRYPDEEAAAHTDAYDTATFLDRLFDEAAEPTAPTGGHLTGNVTGVLTPEMLAAQHIDVYGIEDEGLSAQYRYYVNELYETDAFIGALIATLSDFDEQCAVVFYGDHLPCFDYTSDDLADGTTPFETEYVIWRNYDVPEMPAADRNLSAYQLAAAVLEQLSIHEGILTQLHQTHAGDDDYLSALRMLSYDMLYGDMEVWGGICPHLPTVLQMGIEPITVTGLRALGASLYITGQNFTPFSTAVISGDLCETVYIDASVLLVPDASVTEGMTVSVAQTGSERIILSESGSVVFREAHP